MEDSRFDYPRAGPDPEIIKSGFSSRRHMLDSCRLESMGDDLEQIARRLEYHGEISVDKCNEMLQLAWDLKQVNRRATPSEGI